MASDQLVDVQHVVREWAYSMWKTTAKLSKVPLTYNIDWSLVKIENLGIDFDEVRFRSPKSVVIFTTTFSNNTSAVQKHSLKAERMTHATCHLKLYSGMVRGADMPALEIKLPDDIITKYTGFGQKLLVTQSHHQIFSEELKWTVDSIVAVQPKTTSVAHVEILEETCDTKFNLITQFCGKIHVNLKDAKTNDFIQHIDGDIGEICLNSKTTKDYVKSEGPGGSFVVQIPSSGFLSFNYAIEQSVSVNREELVLKYACTDNNTGSPLTALMPQTNVK